MLKWNDEGSKEIRRNLIEQYLHQNTFLALASSHFKRSVSGKKDALVWKRRIVVQCVLPSLDQLAAVSQLAHPHSAGNLSTEKNPKGSE